jgi:hypothetical protein
MKKISTDIFRIKSKRLLPNYRVEKTFSIQTGLAGIWIKENFQIVLH